MISSSIDESILFHLIVIPLVSDILLHPFIETLLSLDSLPLPLLIKVYLVSLRHELVPLLTHYEVKCVDHVLKLSIESPLILDFHQDPPLVI